MTIRNPKAVRVIDTPEFKEWEASVTLGSIIRDWRLCEEASQTALAKQLGISKQLFSEYERGSKLPSLQKTLEIAATLGAPPEEWLRVRLQDELNTIGYTLEFNVRQAS